MSENTTRSADTRNKQKAIIEFLVFENRATIEIYRRLKAYFGDETFDVSTVRYWVRMAKQKNVEFS